MVFKKKKGSTSYKDSSKDANKNTNKRSDQTFSFQERPRICLLDCERDCVGLLKGHGFNCWNGTLGDLVEVKNTERHHSHQCTLRCEFPDNLHEYDIVVLDMQNPKTVLYQEQDHKIPEVKGDSALALVSSFPETVFDPRALSAFILEKKIKPLYKRETVFVVFAAQQERIAYQSVTVTSRGTQKNAQESYRLYDFYRYLPENTNRSGKDISILTKENSQLGRILRKYNSDVSYEIVFSKPRIWDSENNQYVDDPNFVPMMTAGPDEIVSFVNIVEQNAAFFLPNIKQKPEFLLDFIENTLPELFPKVFPFLEKRNWRYQSEYEMPEVNSLVAHIDEIKAKAESEIAKTNSQIEGLRQNYKTLYDLLTESDETLVQAVIEALRNCGFTKIVDLDKEIAEGRTQGPKREDLQVHDQSPTLIIDVKGINGIPTHDHARQAEKHAIFKIREWGRVDINGLTIINHQRNLPPLQRNNVNPFEQVIINYAEEAQLGLMTTWDLYRLLRNMRKNKWSTEHVKPLFYRSGRILSVPNHYEYIGKVSRIWPEAEVVGIVLECGSIKVGGMIGIELPIEYEEFQVETIQIDDASAEEATVGDRAGVKINLNEIPVKSGMKVYAITNIKR